MNIAVPSESEPSRFRRHLLTALLLMLAAWALYSPSLKYGFIYYDDVRILRDHPELYGQKTFAEDLKAIFITSYPREEPLLVRDVSWAIDSRLFGFGNAFGYHLGNVFLHGIVVALLFVFLLKSTRRYNFALGVAAAYLLLAIHVEPVVWIMGRKDILSVLFMLLALLAQLWRLEAKTLAARIGWYLAMLAFFLAGLFSKINVLTFPAVLFLYAVLLPYLRGEQAPNAALPWRRAFREGLLLIPALALSGCVYIWYKRILSEMGIFDRGYAAHGLAHAWNLLMLDPLVFWVYLGQILFPFHLAVLYSWPTLQPAYSAGQVVASIATVALLIAAGVLLFRRRKDLFFFFGAAMMLMIPYLNLIFMGIWVADRYVYFISFCVIAIIVSVAEMAWHKIKTGARMAMLAIAGILLANNVLQTFSYQGNWRNAETLWQYHLTLPQPDSKSYDNLAAYYFADYTDARPKQDVPRMAKALEKMSVVVNAGLEQFWPDQSQTPPPQTYFLFFLRSLFEDAKGEPGAALASMKISDHLHPGFDSTQYNLSQLCREVAAASKDARERTTYLQAARSYFAEYIKLGYHGRQPGPEDRQEMADIEAALAKSQSPADEKPARQNGQ